MTDTMRLAGQALGRYPAQRWAELVNEMERPVDPRSGEEIAADFIRRAGLKFKDEA